MRGQTMGYPVAYRPAARPYQGGFQPLRRGLDPRSIANARTPMPRYTPSEVLSEGIGILAGGFWQNAAKLIPYIKEWLDQDNPFGVTDNLSGINLPGTWTRCPQPVPGNCVPTHYYYWSSPQSCNSSPGPCPSVGAVGIDGALPFPSGPTPRKINLYRYNAPNDYTFTDQLVNASNQTFTYAQDKPQIMPYEEPIGDPIPDVPPSYDPMQTPIGEPAPDYDPVPYWQVPYRKPSPWRSPVEQPWRGPFPTPRTDPKPRQFPDPVTPSPTPRARPGFSVGADGWLKAPPAWSPPRPQGRYTKERKVVIAISGKIAFIANHITEYQDFIDAWWKAIPKHLRSKGKPKPKLQTKLKEIYDNFNDIDLPQAIKNVIVNEIIDRTYGKAGQYARMGKRNAVGTGYDPGAAGYQLGGRYRPQPNAKGAWDPSIDSYLPRFSMNDVYRAVGWR